MASDQVIYEEVQHARQWWLWLIIAGLSALMTWALVQQIVLGEDFGDNPAPDGVLVGLWLCFGLGFPLMFWWLKLVIRLRPGVLELRFLPFARTQIALNEMRELALEDYSPLWSYGGWGLKWWPGRGRLYSMGGRRGVKLHLKNGDQIMVGSMDAEALYAAIISAKG